MADSSQIRVSYSINSITTATVPGTMALLVLYRTTKDLGRVGNGSQWSEGWLMVGCCTSEKIEGWCGVPEWLDGWLFWWGTSSSPHLVVNPLLGGKNLLREHVDPGCSCLPPAQVTVFKRLRILQWRTFYGANVTSIFQNNEGAIDGFYNKKTNSWNFLYRSC